MVARSPCRGVKLPVVEPARARVLSAHDLRRLKDELPIQYRAMVTLGANLGLRFGETTGLRVGRLDLEAGILHVEEAVGEANGVLFTKPPKTSAARRSLPLTAAVVDELRLHLLRQGLQGEPDAFVFQAPAGGPLRRGLFRARMWAPACRRAGLEGLGFHDLRRTNATMLMASGASIRDAQELLGHKDPRMLLGVYAKSTSEGKRAAVDRLTAALEPADEPPQPPADGGGCAIDVPWMPKRPLNRLAHVPWKSPSSRGFVSGAEGNRTPDPFHAMEVLCQLSYSPGRTVDDTSGALALKGGGERLRRGGGGSGDGGGPASARSRRRRSWPPWSPRPGPRPG